MKFLIYVIAAVFCLITTNSQAAEVAVIYSSWPQGSRAFLLEFDSTFRKMGYKFQALYSYKLSFSPADADSYLSYLKDKVFEVKDVFFYNEIK